MKTTGLMATLKSCRMNEKKQVSTEIASDAIWYYAESAANISNLAYYQADYQVVSYELKKIQRKTKFTRFGKFVVIVNYYAHTDRLLQKEFVIIC